MSESRGIAAGYDRVEKKAAMGYDGGNYSAKKENPFMNQSQHEFLPGADGYAAEPGRRTTLLDFATESIRNAILNGELAMGDRVNEVAFSGRLNISRSIVREALRQLEQVGLLVRVPFRGTFVREFSEDEIRDLNNLRAALETYAVELLVETGGNTAQALEPVYEIVEKMAQIDADKDIAQNNILHVTFHQTLQLLAGNPLLSSVWTELEQQFWVAMRASQRSLFEEGEAVHFADAHRALVDLVAKGDVDEFRREIRRHVSYPAKL